MFRKKAEITNNTNDIAKTIVNRCLRSGYKIYPIKLERMMVIAYGEYLVKAGKRLFDSKISIGKTGPKIKEFYEELGDYDEYLKPFNDEKIFLFDEDVVIRNVIWEYGDKNLAYIDDDPRLMKLKEYKNNNKNISDKDVFEVFTRVSRRAISTPILCSASEKGKWIINRCLKLGIDINTVKLEKLLILAYGEYLVKTGKKLFNENIVIWEAGPMIKEVDEDFRRYAMGFYAPFYEHYHKLEAEQNVIKDIISQYGNMDAFELNDTIELKELMKCKNNSGFVSDADIKRVFRNWRIY